MNSSNDLKKTIDSSQKYIRTINGKITSTEIKNCFVLPYEHIIQNICDYLIKKK